MHDGESLLRSILEAPDDDGPRLVYADWLRENGDEARADFIEVQVKLARLESEAVDLPIPGPRVLTGRIAALRRREHELWAAETVRLMDWCNAIGLDFQRSWPFVVRRGFVERVECRTADFLRHAANLFAAHPVAEVRLADREPAPELDQWWWVETALDDDDRPDRLPEGLFGLLRGGQPGEHQDRGVRYYPALNVAHAALSRACVRRGRGLAGLNPAAGARVQAP